MYTAPCRSRCVRRRCFSIAALLSAAGLAAAASRATAQVVDSTWQGGTSGAWSENRWSLAGFPNNGTPPGVAYRAIISASGAPYRVTLDVPVTVDAIVLSADAATLRIEHRLDLVTRLDRFAGLLELSGGSIFGGILDLHGGRITALQNAANELHAVDVRGDVRIASGLPTSQVALRLTGGVNISGDLGFSSFNQRALVTGGLSVATATISGANTLQFDGDQTISGNYALNGNNDTTFASRFSILSGTVTLAPGSRIRGGGAYVDGAVVNLGTIDSITGRLQVTGSVENRATLSATGTGILDLAVGVVRNLGTIRAGPNGSVQITPDASHWNGDGGEVIADGGRVIALGAYPMSALSSFRVTAASGGDIRLRGECDNTGNTKVLDSTTGSWTLDGGTLRGGTLTQSEGSILRLSGGTLQDVVFNGDINEPDQFGLNFNLRGDVTVNGTMLTTRGGGIGINTGARLVAGTIRSTDGRLNVGLNSGPFTLGPGASIIAGNTSTTSRVDILAPSFVNQGLLQLDSGIMTVGASASGVYTDVRSPGLIRVNGGDFVFGGRLFAQDFGGMDRTGGRVIAGGIIENQNHVLDLDNSTGRWIIGGSSTIRGGTLRIRDNGGLAFINNTGTPDAMGILEDLTIDGRIDVPGASGGFGQRYLLTRGRIDISGALTLGAPNQSITMLASQDPVFSGGEYILQGGRIGTGAGFGDTSLITLTLGATGVFRGFGGIISNGALDNHGSISADVPGTALELGGSTFTNDGVLAATGGVLTVFPRSLVSSGLIRVTAGELQLGHPRQVSVPATQVRFAPGATFERTGGIVTLACPIDNTGQIIDLAQTLGAINCQAFAEIHAGELRIAPSTPVTLIGQPLAGIAGALVLSGNVNVVGNITVPGSGTLRIRDGLRLTGVIANSQITGGPSSIAFEGSQTIEGGEFLMRNAMGIAANSSVSFSPSTLVHGGVSDSRFFPPFAPISIPSTSVLTARGTIDADRTGEGIQLQGGRVVNEGLLRASNGGTLVIGAQANNFVNTGLIQVAASSSVFLDTSTDLASLGNVRNQGGTFLIRSTLTLPSQGLTLDSVTGSWSLSGTLSGGRLRTNDGTLLRVEQGNATMTNIVVAGRVEVASNRLLTLTGSLDGAIIRLAESGASLAATLSGAQDSEIVLGSGGSQRLVTLTGTTALIPAGLTIHGGVSRITSQANSPLSIMGFIASEHASQELQIRGRNVTNQLGGHLAVSNGARITIQATSSPSGFFFISAGEIDLSPSGVLAVSGPIAFTPTSLLRLILSSTAAGSMTATTSVALDGALVLDAPASGLQRGSSFLLISAPSGLTGNFSSLQLPFLADGLSLELLRDQTTLRAVVVPVPSATGLLVLTAFWANRRCRPPRDQLARGRHGFAW